LFIPATVSLPSVAMWTVLSDPSTSTVAHVPVRVTVLPMPWTFAPSVPHATVRRWDMPSTTGRWP
jgi:hypothetical protein